MAEEDRPASQGDTEGTAGDAAAADAAAGDAAAAEAASPETAAAETAAVEAAKAWLSLADSGRYGESWEQASAYLKNVVTKDQFVQSLRGALGPFGQLISRKVESTQYATALPGAPDGEYVVIRFRSSFQNKKEAIETVTPMMEADGRWKVSGYYIK
jgi:hypothetical protein